MSGILARIFGTRASAGGGFQVSETPPGWVEELSGQATAVGRPVSPGTALQNTAVFSCVRILAETLASLPLPVYRRLADGGKQRAQDYYLYGLLHDAPNPEMTSFELRETLMGHVATWGNAYGELELNGAGQARAIWPLRPDRVKIKREAGALVYYLRWSKPDRLGRVGAKLPAYRVLHVRGLGFDGIVGYSPIAMARQAVGLAMAAEEFGARFYANDARPGIVLEHPGKLSEPAHKRLKKSWEERHQGLENAHRVAILEEGMGLKEVGLPPEDAQFIETRKFQLQEMARLFRIPPHMLADLERATFSNIEHQSLEFVIHTIRPWLVRWEQAIHRDIFLESERAVYFAEFLVDGLLRGDIAARYQAYAVGRQNGWLSANDVRQIENMNPIEGGDIYMVPLNMISATQVGTGLGSNERALSNRLLASPHYSPGRALLSGPDRPGDRMEVRSIRARHRLEQVYRPLYEEVLARVLRRERNDISAAVKKVLRGRSQADLEAWLTDFYIEHGPWVYDQIAPVARSYGELVAANAQDEIANPEGYSPELEAFEHAYVASFVNRHNRASDIRIREVLERAQVENLDPEAALLAELDTWPEVRAIEESAWESVRYGSAVALTVYALGGRTEKRWVSFGDTCPYCSDLDGTTIGINEWFISAGQEFQPEGAEKPLKTNWDTGHPPAHRGCDCGVVAG